MDFLRRSRFQVKLLESLAGAIGVGAVVGLLLIAPSRLSAADLRADQIVTVLPKDAIPAILAPSFEEASKASWLDGKQFVVGVEIGGDSRAYPVPTLSRHEIINDRVGGLPIAVTW